MALFLSESDVQDLLPMERALELVEQSFRAADAGRAENKPRERIFLPETSLHYMAAALPEENLMGMKIYTIGPSSWRFLVVLFRASDGALLALIEADHLGRIRTGAASGVATKFLARPDAARLALLGAGRQARTQLEALARVRSLATVRVFSRDEKRRGDFCREMRERLGIDVAPAETAEAAVRSADVVVTATTSRQPVLRGEWLLPGAHVNAIGANMANRRELDDSALARAGLLAVDSIEQSRQESGDLIQGLKNRDWQSVVELREIVAGRRPGRTAADEITVFKSNGIALWDVAVAGEVYRQATKTGRGRKIDWLT